MRKPFDTIVEGLNLKIGTNNRTWLELYLRSILYLVRKFPEITKMAFLLCNEQRSSCQTI